jgi:hypothetical protein
VRGELSGPLINVIVAMQRGTAEEISDEVIGPSQMFGSQREIELVGESEQRPKDAGEQRTPGRLATDDGDISAVVDEEQY